MELYGTLGPACADAETLGLMLDAGMTGARLNLSHTGLEGGALIANPIPKEYELDFDEMETVINRALSMAKEQGIHGKDTTPFLLAHIKDLTGGESLASNLQLAYNNARVASRIAVEYCKLP